MKREITGKATSRTMRIRSLATKGMTPLYVSLIGCIFFPLGLASSTAGMAQYAIGFASYALKLLVAGSLLAIFETSIAKMRVFRVPNFIGIALMLGFLGTLLLFVSRSM